MNKTKLKIAALVMGLASGTAFALPGYDTCENWFYQCMADESSSACTWLVRGKCWYYGFYPL